MKTFIIIVLLFCACACAKAQNDTIFIISNKMIICTHLKESDDQYEFDYITTDNKIANSSIRKWLVDSVKYSARVVDSNSINGTKKNSNLAEDSIPPDSTALDSNGVAKGEIVQIPPEEGIPPDSTAPDSNGVAKGEIALIPPEAGIPPDSTALDTNGVVQSDIVLIPPEEAIPPDSTKVSPWLKTIAFGFNFGYILERNNPAAPNSDIVNFATAFHLGLSYFKDSCKFQMTNELHYLSGVQNESISGGIKLKRMQDDLSTLHDFSYSVSKDDKVKANLILRSATSVFTIYDGDYYKDINSLGPNQGFLSPYDLIISPGIKYQPNEFLRMSFSIYAFQLYGIANDKIAQKGIFITDFDENCKYKTFLFRHLGAEFNLWYDGQIKEWLFVQYRLSISTDYFEAFGKNGLIDGLFITKIKIFKDFYLSHQATLKTNFAVDFLKPFYNQMILFTYEKSF